jgi:hypothetical protein
MVGVRTQLGGGRSLALALPGWPEDPGGSRETPRLRFGSGKRFLLLFRVEVIFVVGGGVVIVCGEGSSPRASLTTTSGADGRDRVRSLPTAVTARPANIHKRLLDADELDHA